MSRFGNEMLVTIANMSPRGREEHVSPLIAVTSGVASREGKRFKRGLDRQKITYVKCAEIACCVEIN